MLVLIVELSTSHTEIIEPFVSALNDCQVQLAIPETSWNKISNKSIFSKVYLLDEQRAAKQAAKIINDNSFDLIVYNSAQGKNIRNLVLKTFFNKTPVVGFHHNPINLIKSFTQKIINLKVKKYLVLADFNNEYLIQNGFPSENVHSFYPVTAVTAVDHSLNKLISIPGVLEQDRRDYFGLVDIIKENPKAFDGYQFALLGNSLTHDGPAIKKMVERENLSQYFIFFDGYVQDNILDEHLRKSKFVMPLMHPDNRYFEIYLKTKVSGAYNLAYAYQLPLLMHETFATVSEFQTNCVFYEFGDLAKKIQQSVVLNREFYKKFDTDVQSKKLLRFIIPS